MSPAKSCNYCGRANTVKLPTCAGCGTSLVSALPAPANTVPARKSKTVAILLSLIFGPLGLIYVRGWGQAFVMIAIGFPFILTHKGGLWLAIGSRLLSAAWAYSLVVEQDEAPNPARDAGRLLEEAARLENVDFHKAISAYEEIILQYPNSNASKQAASAIETLKRSI